MKEKEAELQSAAMLARRVMHSETHAQISMLFNASPSLVAKRLQEARSGDLQQMAKDILTERMLPKALSILDTELQNGNYEAAKDILFGLQVLQKGGTAKIEHVTSSTPTLDAIRKEHLKAIEGTVTEVTAPEQKAPSA